MATRVVAEGMSVRAVEEAVAVAAGGPDVDAPAPPRSRPAASPRLAEVAAPSPTGSRRASESTWVAARAR